MTHLSDIVVKGASQWRYSWYCQSCFETRDPDKLKKIIWNVLEITSTPWPCDTIVKVRADMIADIEIDYETRIFYVLGLSYLQSFWDSQSGLLYSINLSQRMEMSAQFASLWSSQIPVFLTACQVEDCKCKLLCPRLTHNCWYTYSDKLLYLYQQRV